jgi:hypothetical protein
VGGEEEEVRREERGQGPRGGEAEGKEGGGGLEGKTIRGGWEGRKRERGEAMAATEVNSHSAIRRR